MRPELISGDNIPKSIADPFAGRNVITVTVARNPAYPVADIWKRLASGQIDHHTGGIRLDRYLYMSIDCPADCNIAVVPSLNWWLRHANAITS